MKQTVENILEMIIASKGDSCYTVDDVIEIFHAADYKDDKVLAMEVHKLAMQPMDRTGSSRNKLIFLAHTISEHFIEQGI